MAGGSLACLDGADIDAGGVHLVTNPVIFDMCRADMHNLAAGAGQGN